MASGATRRARKRALVDVSAEAARIRALRAMAEKDPVREQRADVLPNRSRDKFFAKRGSDAMSMYGRVGGNGIYSGMRCNKLPRGRDHRA
jgi:hypothetical protein